MKNMTDVQYDINTEIDLGLDMDTNILNIKCGTVRCGLYVLSNA